MFLPGLNLDYVSYSAYESINNSNPATTLTTDIQNYKKHNREITILLSGNSVTVPTKSD